MSSRTGLPPRSASRDTRSSTSAIGCSRATRTEQRGLPDELLRAAEVFRHVYVTVSSNLDPEDVEAIKNTIASLLRRRRRDVDGFEEWEIYLILYGADDSVNPRVRLVTREDDEG